MQARLQIKKDAKLRILRDGAEKKGINGSDGRPVYFERSHGRSSYSILASVQKMDVGKTESGKTESGKTYVHLSTDG